MPGVITDMDWSFRCAIIAEPGERVHRLAYADWLEDEGRSMQALKVRAGHGLITIPEVLPLFVEYRRGELAWGSMHIVLEDHNLGDDCVEYCIRYAIEKGDENGAILAMLLLLMTKSQRWRLDDRVSRALGKVY